MTLCYSPVFICGKLTFLRLADTDRDSLKAKKE